MDLSERKLKILKAIIDNYIETGVPVGSRTLSKKAEIPYSSATIRNEMADLEEMGFLEKPHTSAGRTPSDCAYRLYVDKMMRVGALTVEETAFIHGYFDKRVDEIFQVLDTAAKAISEVTTHIAVVSAPHMASPRISRVQLVKLNGGRALLVVVLNSGLVRDIMIPVPEGVSDSQLETMSNMISETLRDVDSFNAADKVRELANSTANGQRQVLNSVFEALAAGVSKEDVALYGAQNIFSHQEYKDLAKARAIMGLLDRKERLCGLLKGNINAGYAVKIGSENQVEGLTDVSVITATYVVKHGGTGSFAVIGPTRMDYAKALSVLDYVGESLSRMLSDFAV